MDLGLAGKTALVTAASEGLGFGCAQALAAEGCKLAICGRDKNKLDRAVNTLRRAAGMSVIGFAVDVTVADDVATMVRDIRQQLGPIDILVTNAGGPPTGTAQALALDDLDRAMQFMHAAADADTMCAAPEAMRCVLVGMVDV